MIDLAEAEISVMTEQCLHIRLGSQEIVTREACAWEAKRNYSKATTDWCFTITIARDKLNKLYPVGEA